MKKAITIISVAGAILCCACSKTANAPVMGNDAKGKLITFSMNELNANVVSKATIADVAITNIGKIYVHGATISSSTESAWSAMVNEQITISNAGAGTSVNYWPATGNLSFYAASWDIAKTLASNDATSSITYAGGSNDYVCGAKKNATNKADVALEMNHILARLYDIKFKTTTGATATVDAVSVTPQFTVGTYTYGTNAWSSQKTAGSAHTITPSTKNMTTTSTSIGQSAVDYTMLPGTANAKLYVKYTITRNGYSKTFEKNATVTLPQGQKSTVEATLTDDASPITFTVTVNPWTTGTVNATLS